MKAVFILLAFVCLSLPASAEDYWEERPISGADLVKMLELDIRKYTVRFNEPTFVSLEFKSFCQDQKWILDLPQTEVSVLVYIPKESEQKKELPQLNEMTIMIRGESHGQSILSYGTFEESKVKFTTIDNLSGFEMVGKESEDAEEVVYRLRVAKHEQKPTGED